MATAAEPVMSMTGGRPFISISVERVRAECEAKRRLVEHHSSPHDEHDHQRQHGIDGYDDAPGAEPCPTLRLLSLPYADHPDFRAAWRP